MIDASPTATTTSGHQQYGSITRERPPSREAASLTGDEEARVGTNSRYFYSALLPSWNTVTTVLLLVMVGYLTHVSHQILAFQRSSRSWVPKNNNNLQLGLQRRSETMQHLRYASAAADDEVEDSSSTTRSKPEQPIRILIVYGPSDDPYQELMARYVAKGASTFKDGDEIQVTVGTVDNTTFAKDVLQAHAVILGSSVENANVHPAVQQWMNIEWDIEQAAALRNTVGGAFCTAGAMSAGEEGTLQNLLHSMLVFQMITVGGDTWEAAFGASAVTYEEPWGLSSETNPYKYFHGESSCDGKKNENVESLIHLLFLDKAIGLGRRVAEVTLQLHGNKCIS